MIYALYHYEPETMGIVRNQLDSAILAYQEIRLYRGDHLPSHLSVGDGLIVMGGPMSVHDQGIYPYLRAEMRLIEKCLTQGNPILGICLGAQLIAKAAGAQVYPNKEKEVGWGPIRLTAQAQINEIFKQAPTQFQVLHWHGETFDLPKGAIHLAQSEKCDNQAFQMGSRVLGLQFHLEAEPNMIKTWIQYPQGQRDIRDAQGDAVALVEKSPELYSTLEPVAEKIFTTYLREAYG